jgi:protein-S-isoprenylcysteine O-methyltransferase Ste14
MLVIRNWPERVSSSPYDWTIGILGTTLPLLMQPSDTATHQIFLIIQMAGLVISAIGVMSLFKSFGIVAANRGVRTSGIYRFIRHPLYAGYFLSHSSFVIQNFSITNLAVFTAFSVFQILRIFAEEKFLAQDPVYADYMQKTRWRLLPFIW